MLTPHQVLPLGFFLLQVPSTKKLQLGPGRPMTIPGTKFGTPGEAFHWRHPAGVQWNGAEKIHLIEDL